MPIRYVFGSFPKPFTNFALASNGGVATASSELDATFIASKANDGVRRSALNDVWISANNADAGTGEWLEIAFSGTKTISEVDIFSQSDTYPAASDPTLSDTGSSFQVVNFKIQYWDGSAWQDITSVTGNTNIWRQFTFAPISTTKIRALVTLNTNGLARIAELEAWG